MTDALIIGRPGGTISPLLGKRPPMQMPGEAAARTPERRHNATDALARFAAAPPVATSAVLRSGEDAAQALRRLLQTSDAQSAIAAADPAAAGGPALPSGPMLVLIDPERLWAPRIVRRVAEAAAQPVQRLQLLAHGSAQALAIVEWTEVELSPTSSLRMVHVDLPAATDGAPLPEAGAGPIDPALLAAVLAGRSTLAVVLVGAMPPRPLMTLLRGLLQATHEPEWRCRQLLFAVPEQAQALRQRVLAQPWPGTVDVQALAMAEFSAAALCDSVLAHWRNHAARARSAQRIRLPVAPAPDGDATAGGHSPLLRLDLPVHVGSTIAAAIAPPTAVEDADRAASATTDCAYTALLSAMNAHDGVQSCGVVELDRAALLAWEIAPRALPVLDAALDIAPAPRGAGQAAAAVRRQPPTRR